MTVLFTDIVGSSEIAAEFGDLRWKQLLEAHHAIVRRALKRHGGRELDTAGDGFFAVFDRQAEAMRCAVEIVDDVRSIGLEVRAGLHVGETEVIAGKAGGVAVHTGARIGAIAGPGEVIVSGVLRDLVPGSGIEFDDRGAQQLKGIPEEIRTYAVRAVDGVDVREPLDPDEAARRRSAAAEPSARHRSALLVGGIAGGAVLVALLATSLWDRETPPPAAAPTPTMVPIPPETLVRLDENTLVEEQRFPLSGEPIDITESAGRVWILEDRLLEWVIENSDSDTVQRVGLGSPSPCAIAPANRGVLLVDCAERRLYRVTEHKEENPVLVNELPSFGDAFVIVNSPRGLWIRTAQEEPPEDRIYHLDPATGAVIGPPKALSGSGSGPLGMVEAGGYLWTFNSEEGGILRIAPTTLETRQIEEGSAPNGIAASTDSVWVNDIGTAEIILFDLSGHVLDRVSRHHGVLAGTPDGVWALDLDHLIHLIKVGESAKVAEETLLGYADGGVRGDPMVAAGGSVWIGVRSADFEA